MAWYAIGDVQGCHTALRRLLAELDFDQAKDRLWFTGDLVNRGPDSLSVLRWVRGLGDRAATVLGNHDLHLLAYAEGLAQRKAGDTLDPILSAPDRDELLDWLRQRPLLVREAGNMLIHAGLAPEWGMEQAELLAREVESALRGDRRSFRRLLRDMYGNEPDHWYDGLVGAERQRVIINAFTRLRFCRADGRMGLRFNGPPGSQPDDYRPWYEFQRDLPVRLVFGHWAAHGARARANALCLDQGCVWGGRLTAVRLDADPPRWFSVDCRSQPQIQQG